MQIIQLRNKQIQIPLIQGGMGVGVSLGNLAGHVAKCGGLGMISAAHTGYRCDDFWQNFLEDNLAEIKSEIHKAKEIAGGNGMVGVNVMVALHHYEALVQAAVDGGADAIISGAGIPMELPGLVGDADIALAPIVSSGKSARVICQAWKKRHDRLPDFIVIEGSKAGGHLGFAMEELQQGTTQPLEEIFNDVQAVVQTFEETYGVKIPIFVAGGVYTGCDLKKFTDMGAAGAQMATRFITTHECDASQAYKERYLNVQPEDIVLIKSPVGMPGRALKSPMIKRILEGGKERISRCLNCLRPCDPRVVDYCITSALSEAAKGNWEDGLFFCGSNAHRMKKIVHVRELIDEIMQEYHAGVCAV